MGLIQRNKALKVAARADELAAENAAEAAKAINAAKRAILEKERADEETRRADNLLEEVAKERDQSRHFEGTIWLERAENKLNDLDIFSAKLLAGRAIGFDEAGRTNMTSFHKTQLPVLLKRDTDEWLRAVSILNSRPDNRLLWQSPIQKHHNNSVLSIKYSPDGKILASGSWDNTIKLWDIKHIVKYDNNYAKYLQLVDIKKDGFVFRDTSNRLFTGNDTYLSTSPLSYINILQNKKGHEKVNRSLFLHYLSASNLKSARVMLEQLKEDNFKHDKEQSILFDRYLQNTDRAMKNNNKTMAEYWIIQVEQLTNSDEQNNMIKKYRIKLESF